MLKDELNKAVEAFKNEMRENLQTFYDALPPGQQNKNIKERNHKGNL